MHIPDTVSDLSQYSEGIADDDALVPAESRFRCETGIRQHNDDRGAKCETTYFGSTAEFERVSRGPIFRNGCRLPPDCLNASDEHSANHNKGHRADRCFETARQALVATVKVWQSGLGAAGNRVGRTRDLADADQCCVAGCVDPMIVGGRKVNCREPAVLQFRCKIIIGKQPGKRIVDAFGLQQSPAANDTEFTQVAVRRRGERTRIGRLSSRTGSQFAREKILETRVVGHSRARRILERHGEKSHPQPDQKLPQPRASGAGHTSKRARQPRLWQQILYKHDGITHGGVA